MTERQALIGFGILSVVVEVIAIKGLALLGADTETQASACVLLLSAIGLGGGFVFLRYH